MAEKLVILELAKHLIASDSDSDSESEEEIESLLIMTFYKKCLMLHARCANYVENVVPLYTDIEFKMHFRMKRSTFQFLLELLKPQLCKQSKEFGRHPISPEKQLLIAIWTMVTSNSYRCVSDRFDVGKATAWRSVQRVVNALYANVTKFIRWPTREKAEKTIETIQRNQTFPGVIGAIDGTHIKITAPKDHHDSYINRKGFHSIQLQVSYFCFYRFIYFNIFFYFLIF
ncbi:Putative nuclease HARBI1 [Cyphomyrmex costatus]|uniref:Putative nuclease HARBI1 n=1 Tax=Cyphomyrmex costatus TaxID=456900 RepID=A0A151IIF7_9HYME|nr:Putative nuclease HARBI1 [Cyphomyrmex costatus]